MLILAFGLKLKVFLLTCQAALLVFSLEPAGYFKVMFINAVKKKKKSPLKLNQTGC